MSHVKLFDYTVSPRESVLVSLSLFISGFALSGKKAMSQNRNIFIERDLFEQFISYTRLNPAVSQQL
jgi:hypothetical protein